MHLRTMSAAILFHEDRILLMKRSATRQFAPGVWGPVGGHMEPAEVNDPQTACLREVEEETGMIAGDLQHLRMRYLLLRREAEELRVHYFYTAEVCGGAVQDMTDEGKLHWVQPAILPKLPMSHTFRAVLQHCLERPDDLAVYAAVTTQTAGEPWVEFLELTDWRGMETLHLPI